MHQHDRHFSLSILMMYANAGNIDSYIGSRYSSPDDQVFEPGENGNDDPDLTSASERKRMFRRRRLSSKTERASGIASAYLKRDARGVILFNRDELESLFGDVIEGLTFLVSRVPDFLTAHTGKLS
jgi:hypothetical protein